MVEHTVSGLADQAPQLPRSSKSYAAYLSACVCEMHQIANSYLFIKNKNNGQRIIGCE